jgi:hypothetical protein
MLRTFVYSIIQMRILFQGNVHIYGIEQKEIYILVQNSQVYSS